MLKSAKEPSARWGAAKSWTLRSRLPGVPMGRTGAVCPSPTKTTASKLAAAVTAPASEEEHETRVREQRGQLLVLVAVAVDDGGPIGLGDPLAPEVSGTEGILHRADGAHGVCGGLGWPGVGGDTDGRRARQLDGRPLPAAGIEERLRLLDADVAALPARGAVCGPACSRRC